MNHLAQAITAAFEVLLKVAIPLYADDQAGIPQPLGTGFFVKRSDGSTLLVSAAHVLEEAKARKVYYFIGSKQRRMITGKITSNRCTGPRSSDLLDIAAVRLEGESLPPYPEVDKVHFNAADLVFASPTPTARYGAIGFPASRSRVRHRPAEIRVEPYGLLAELAPMREYASRGLRPESHLYLVFNRKKSFSLQGQGRSFPKPHGLSGAPVFEIFDEAKSHQDEAFPLAGIVTTWHRQEHRMLCSSAAAIRELIEVAA